MPAIAIRILVAGTPSESTTAILNRLAMHGWEARTVATIQQAWEQLESFAFAVALASEALPDGLGYELGSGMVRQGATLFVGVALSESALWLPVIERGSRVLGTRGISPRALLQEMESLLRARDREQDYRLAVSEAAARAFGASIRSRAWRRAPGYGHRPRQPLAGCNA
jgi:DNA-binding response OmpR family regulator